MTHSLRSAGGRRGSAVAATAALAAALVAAVPTYAAPPAHAAPSVADAQAQADRLRAAVERLQVAAERATEDYDAAQEQLGAAVQQYMSADEELGTAQRRSDAAYQSAAARVRALYEAGGSLALYASALGGSSINDALNGVALADSVIADSRSRARASGAEVAHIAALKARLGQLAARQESLQAAAAAKASRVRDLLGRQQSLLAAADQQVRDLMAAQAQARAQQAAAAFAAQLAAAREQALAQGLPVGAISAPTPVAAAAIAAARTRLGSPYVWGATGPATFDCSGLTQWSYAQAGLALPRTAAEQWYAGPHPALADLAPGDLLFWATDPADPATIHHVALYLGDGLMIAAPHTGTVVQVQPVYLDGFVGAVRPTG